MARLEDLTRGTHVTGIVPGAAVTVVAAEWHGGGVVDLTYRDPDGNLGSRLIYRDDEPQIQLLEVAQPWSFDADGALFRLVSEAHRIRLGYLFDPHLAVSTSLVEPLPHQITAVYEEMLPRQPLRFLLADDPGAGKTIMAGLLIKELMARGDVKRCMVICPGALVEQWQDELWSRFHLPFEILTNDKLEAARTSNWFQEEDLILCRLDKLARDEDSQAKLRATDWDLVICDEAHKLSATVYGREIKRTKRHRPLLAENPLTGIERPREKNPRRPVASHQRFQATRAHADEVDPKGRLRCVLALARHTGRRESAICAIRASDLLLSEGRIGAALAAAGMDERMAEHMPHGAIRWAAESDKQGLLFISPINRDAREALELYLRRNPRMGDVPLFPAPGPRRKKKGASQGPEKPMRRETAAKWLVKAEQLAGLPKLVGGVFHPYRRLWATERKDLPLVDVAAAGGWKDTQALRLSYQHADAETVLRVVEGSSRGA